MQCRKNPKEGGKDLELRSTWLDLNTEKQLLYHYIKWAQIESGYWTLDEAKNSPEKERSFY